MTDVKGFDKGLVESKAYIENTDTTSATINM